MIRLRFAAIESADWGCTTRFDDGATVGAVPHWETPHYHVIAHRCGYGDDLLRYCVEHEASHLIVEEMIHGRASRVLWGLAHEQPLPPNETVYEEAMAQALQRFVRAAERPIVGGVDWDALRDRFLSSVGEF